MAPEPPAPVHPPVHSPVHSWWITDSGVEGQRGDPSLLFPYWSFTKTVIAICALKLSKRGQVDLDKPLDGEAYSLRQLLNHTAGLPDYGGIEGPSWAGCGYGLGLMSGAMAGVGRAVGHSGAGPFCVNAVYHFPDPDDPITVASFTDGCDEGRAEFEAAAIAAR